MKTRLVTYSFNLEKAEDREPYHQLKHKLLQTPGRGYQMHAIKSNQNFNPQTGEIELEPEFLFENQWNSNVGRVFDWYEEAVFDYRGKENKLLKHGHYLEITDEMREIRRNTLKCGYTGQQFPAAKGYIFNETDQALASPYLKESELHLVRLLPVCEEFKTKRQPLTEAERAHLLPLYIKAQTKTNTKARDKQRKEVLTDYENAVAKATTERDGFTWLLDHGIQLENCIFYDHVGQFSFGWRQPYTGEARIELLKLLAAFPFSYDVK